MSNHFYYAPSEQHIKLAAEFGTPNVVIDSRGHGGAKITGLDDDQVCLMPKYNRIYKIRKSFKMLINFAPKLFLGCGYEPIRDT